MNTTSRRLVFPCVLVVLAWLCPTTAHCDLLHMTWDTVVFSDDFDQPDCGRPDPEKWIVNHPDAQPPLNPDWWVQGRSHFPNPARQTTPRDLLPFVKDGVCVIRQRLYNPLDSGHWTFVGGEISTRNHFSLSPTQAYCIEVRVRSNASPDGLVTSFFLYGYDGNNSDEIDFEFLSNETNLYEPDLNPSSPSIDDAVHLTAWNESRQRWSQSWPDALHLTEWNTFRLYWDPRLPRIDWTWLDPVNGEVRLRSETNPSYVPDQAMDLYFNFWAATDAWPKAFASSLQPVDNLELDQTFTYEIDYVRVFVPEPATLTSLLLGAACGAIWLLGSRRRIVCGR